jgi:phenylalanyl-tRNA synthetase alpha chain
VTTTLLSPDAVASALAVRDLTDPSSGPHALQLLVDDAVQALQKSWSVDVRLWRSRPIVSVEDNYDRLRYERGAVTREARYSHYVSETCLLRTHTSALVSPALRDLATQGPIRDTLVACPGIVYRRDSIDRLHTGTPHQLDLWRIAPRALGRLDLARMVAVLVDAVLPGAQHRTLSVVHPYTEGGLQVDVLARGEWVEIAECGLASPDVLALAGLDVQRLSGLALGLGLDRVLMLRKTIPDIRLLRASDPRVASQMLDLSPYRPVSAQPPIVRDLSVAVETGASPESIGDRVRDALGQDASSVEAVEVLSETALEALPAAAAQRLGIKPGQKNVLLRVVIRDLDRTLTSAEANALRDRIYAAIHGGSTTA